MSHAFNFVPDYDVCKKDDFLTGDFRVSRGFRNNNPLNIRKGSKWKGLAAVQSDKSFCVFVEMLYGIRAAIYLLLKYYKKYNLHTLYDIISRWAPECENDTWNYCKVVATEMKIPVKYIPTLDLDLSSDYDRLYDLLCAMIYVENGHHLYIDRDAFNKILRSFIPSSLK